MRVNTMANFTSLSCTYSKFFTSINDDDGDNDDNHCLNLLFFYSFCVKCVYNISIVN